ncbi:MAG TPA: hypothetical protein VNW68_02915 [Candidatus Limnocylindria bacterium]|nr:hypothetical protein [Candidatus Limnocylindria bacterium]
MYSHACGTAPGDGDAATGAVGSAVPAGGEAGTGATVAPGGELAGVAGITLGAGAGGVVAGCGAAHASSTATSAATAAGGW